MVKKKKKKWIIPMVIVAVLAVLIYFGATAIRQSRQMLTDAQTRTATVARGDIELSVAGSGSLSADDSVDVEIPSVLPIKEMQVELGDVVKAGDVLATLDADELQNSIAQVQDEIAAIDEEIDAAESGEGGSAFESPVAGRVKEIAVGEGAGISEVMTQNGYLMVLSLDGKMKVDIQSEATPQVGSDVTVVLENGDEEEGKVVSSGASMFSVTLADNDAAPGQTVSVQGEDGQLLGSGALEINAPLNIVASSGTVESVDVELNDKVEKGGTLLTLSSSVTTEEYQKLARERIGYETLLRKLLGYAETNAIVAEIDGSITEIQQGQQSASSDASSGVDVGSILNNLPIAAKGDSAVSFDTLAYKPTENEVETLPAQPRLAAKPTKLANGTDAASGMQPQAEQPPVVTEIVGVIDVPIAQPALGGTPQAVILPGVGYTGTIAWEPAATFFGPQTAYTAVVILQAEPGFRFADDVQVTVAGANIEGLAVSAEAEKNTVSFRAAFPPTEALPADIDMEQYINGILQNSLGDIGNAVSGLGNLGGSFSIDGSSLGQGSGTTGVSTAMTAVCTITPGKEYYMIAEIDEVDIFSIEVGQKAKIVMDAMLDDVFMGEVTKISTVGTSQSGVATYPVTVRLDTTETVLLGGMNATANIITEIRENVPTIPLEALQERGDETYVYLYDPQRRQDTPSEGEQLGEIRVVEAGISDGVNVEIISGLTEGEEIIYTVIESNAFLEAIMSMGGAQSQSGDGTQSSE